MLNKGIKFTVGKDGVKYGIGRFLRDYYPNQPKEGMMIRWPVEDEDGNEYMFWRFKDHDYKLVSMSNGDMSKSFNTADELIDYFMG